MASLYRGAEALVFPSLFEGFGVPIVEAMACGCPVLTSNRTACPEIAGSSALLVDPYTQKDILEGMSELARNNELRGKLRKRGLENARKFCWENTALSYKKIFEKIISDEK